MSGSDLFRATLLAWILIVSEPSWSWSRSCLGGDSEVRQTSNCAVPDADRPKQTPKLGR
jgi:hypothetical protein